MGIEECILDYSAESVREALELWADGTPDPDPERRADLVHAYKALPLDEATALSCREAGWSLSRISMWTYGKSHPMYASRLLARAFLNLRIVMNGGQLVTNRTTRRIVLGQDHAG